MGIVTSRNIKIIRNRPTRFTEQNLNKVALGRLRELVLFSNWSRRVFLAGYGKEALPAMGDVNNKVLMGTKQAYKAFTLMDNVYDCPDSWFWFENAAAYAPYIVNKETTTTAGCDVIKSPQSVFLNQVRAEMVNPNSKFSPSFIAWASALSKSEVCFSNVSLRSVMSRLGHIKSKMNFVFPLRLKRRKVAQTASYGLFKKQWRQLARSKQLASRAKVSDLLAWARAANNLDVS